MKFKPNCRFVFFNLVLANFDRCNSSFESSRALCKISELIEIAKKNRLQKMQSLIKK